MQDPQGSEAVKAPTAAKRSSPWVNFAVLFVSLLTTFLLIEIGYRVVAGLPVFAWTNWRTENVSFLRLGEHTMTDPVLGWTNVPWTHADNYETIDHGIRRNFDETSVQTGAVLAVGDSFTEGWEVDSSESWPAALESLTGVPIVNAGISNYGTDQIILRAEQMLPIVKPKILIIGFLQDDIFRTGYSTYRAPKPYFTIENGELRYHPPGPLEPRESRTFLSSIGYALRDGLGHLAIADYLLARLNPDYWYGTESEMYKHRPEINEVAVTCALLKRLKAQTDKAGIRTMLFMQYTAQFIMASSAPMREAQDVMACAREAGLRVADHFPSLRGLAVRAGNAMKEYYVYSRDYGHMSASGNRHAAEVLSKELEDWLKDFSVGP